MKNLKPLLSVVTLALATFGLAQTSQADFASSNMRTGSPLETLTPVNSSDTLRIYNKLIIEGGKQYAHQFQANGQVTDMFLAAKNAAADYRGQAFESNEEAAEYIVNFQGE